MMGEDTPLAAAQPSALLRKIWSDSNCVLLNFVGSSAEFAINPAAEWLFYTGRLPADPIGRFAGTLRYVQKLMFAPTATAYAQTAREIRKIHTELEKKRGETIPDISYRDVLFMNLEYSLRAYPFVFGRELLQSEKNLIVQDFQGIGSLMSVPQMPATFDEYQAIRAERYRAFSYSEWTERLLDSYKQTIGAFRFHFFLLPIYRGLVAPEIAATLRLQPHPSTWLFQQLSYPACRTGLGAVLRALILPIRARTALLEWRGERPALLSN